MSAIRTVLRPACMACVDARQLADAWISDIERAGQGAVEQIDRLLAQAEAASRFLAPTIVGPTWYQKLWQLRFFTQTLELPTVRVVEQLVRTLDCHFVDVGAHVGYFSIIATAAGAREVTAVEMHPENWRLLRVNTPGAKSVLAAAGASESHSDYFVGRGHSNHSLLERLDTSENRARTTVMPLDRLVVSPASGGTRLVKIDVQGNEAQVLLGFREGLLAGNAILIFEVERNDRSIQLDCVYEEAIQDLQRCCYRLFSIQDQELVEIIGVDDPYIQGLPVSSNILAVPEALYSIFEAAIHRRDL